MFVIFSLPLQIYLSHFTFFYPALSQKIDTDGHINGPICPLNTVLSSAIVCSAVSVELACQSLRGFLHRSRTFGVFNFSKSICLTNSSPSSYFIISYLLHSFFFFFSSFSNFLRWILSSLTLEPLFSSNICRENKIHLKNGFSCIPHVLICLIFIIIQFKVFLNSHCNF